jgi:hypothetical protein
MPGAKYTETYKKVSAMGEKLKAAGKQGPSNDEQLHVRFSFFKNNYPYPPPLVFLSVSYSTLNS